MRCALQSLFTQVHRRCRARRAELFRRHLRPSPQDQILDLGGGYGDYFAEVVPFRKNVWIAEIDERILRAARRHGFQTVLIPPNGTLPFADRSFDIVHCNSVIEHVLAPDDRARLAAEIRRIGRNWFIQTPNVYFWIEPHSRMPFGQFLPQPALRRCLPHLARIWDHHDTMQWRLLNAKELLALFPQGRLIRERFLGWTKSLVVIGGERVRPQGQTCMEPGVPSPSPA